MLGYVRLRKTMWRHFNIYDRERMEKFLERQALKGWILDDFAGNFWYFRKELPKKRHYSIIYMPKNIMTEDVFNQRVGEFQDYCSHAGWKCETANDYIRIYYNDLEDPTPIETDPATQLESMQKVVRLRQNFRLHWWFPILAITTIFNSSVRRYGTLTGIFFSHMPFVVVLTCIALLALYVTEKISYRVWLKKAKEDIEIYGSFSSFHSYSYLKAVIIAAFLLLFGISCVITHNVAMLLLFGIVPLFMLLLFGAFVFVQEKMFSKAKQYIQALIFIGGFALLLMAAKPLGPVYERIDMDTGAQPPISVQDIWGEDADNLRESWHRDESLFAASYEYHGDTKLGDIRYHITTVNVPFLYEPSFKGIQEFHSWDDYMEIPAQEWNAQRAYMLVGQNGYHYYLICYEDLILELNTEKVELSQEQIAMIAEKLSNFS